MSSRRYVKRVWRVPKDRGPVHYFSALLVKALVKHGWPVEAHLHVFDDGFTIREKGCAGDLPDDMADAVSAAVRVVARMYRVEVVEAFGVVYLQKRYRVAPGGHFREVKHGD